MSNKVGLIDCFLYNGERELLEIRLRLLSPIVDKFIIVRSSQTFSGKANGNPSPVDNPEVIRRQSFVQVIDVPVLKGRTPWEREAFLRNSLALGIRQFGEKGLALISDIDELPNPHVLAELKDATPNCPLTFALKYYNFKFNYELCAGRHATWAGPILLPTTQATDLDKIRSERWQNLAAGRNVVKNAGWHFSYLTANGDLRSKLKSFSHQEAEVQSRIESANELIGRREGFHDHMYAGSVWAVVPVDYRGCPELRTEVMAYPEFLVSTAPDEEDEVLFRIRTSGFHIANTERHKQLRNYSGKELAHELYSRVWKRLRH